MNLFSIIGNNLGFVKVKNINVHSVLLKTRTIYQKCSYSYGMNLSSNRSFILGKKLDLQYIEYKNTLNNHPVHFVLKIKKGE